MNTEALFIFLILLLSLFLFSFLGQHANFNSTSIEGYKNTYDMCSNDLKEEYDSSSNNYDNYNHYQGTTTLTPGNTYYGPNGGSILVIANSNGSTSLQVTLSSGQAPVTYTSSTTTGSNGSVTTYSGPNGGTATIVNSKNGQIAIKVKTSSGTYTFTQGGFSNSNISSTQYYGSTGYSTQPTNTAYDTYSSSGTTQLQPGMTYYGPNGGSILVISNSNGSTSLQVTMSSGQAPTTYTTSTNSGSVITYYGPNGSTAVVITVNNEEAIQLNTSSGTYTFTESGSSNYNPNNTNTSTSNTSSTNYNPYYNGTSSTQYYGSYGGSPGSVPSSSTNTNPYNSSLPPGIPASQIPPGSENLYILKSEVVPPVCPVCPSVSNTNTSSSTKEKCQPCPPCGRCPEPSFECKKVPNYNAINNEYLPVPVLNNFSTFGM